MMTQTPKPNRSLSQAAPRTKTRSGEMMETPNWVIQTRSFIALTKVDHFSPNNKCCAKYFNTVI